MVRGAVLSPELAQTIHRMRQDGMKLAEISPLVGLGISWISEILRGTNAETGKKTNAKKRGRKPVDGLDNVLLLEVMFDYNPCNIPAIRLC